MKIVKVPNWTDGRIFATLLVPKEHSRDNLRTGLLFPTVFKRMFEPTHKAKRNKTYLSPHRSE